MAERLEFREKLAGILALCASQNNITDKTTVEEYFAEDNLSKEQMELVFDYLLSQKVIVKGYVKAGGSIKNAENTERTQSVGEGKKAHPRDDQKVLPRQTWYKRGGTVRGVQGAHGVRALPPRKVSF